MAFLPALIPIITAVASTAAGAIISGVGAKNQAEAQAKASFANEKALREQASLEEARVRRMNAVELGRQRASLAKTGVALEGTPLDQLVRNVNEMEQNAIFTGRDLNRQANLEARTGRSALGAGRTALLANLFAGGAQAFSMASSSGLLTPRAKPQVVKIPTYP